MRDVTSGAPEFLAFLHAVAASDERAAISTLRAHPALATMRADSGATRADAPRFFIREVERYIYTGDTALHVAAAGYRTATAHALLAAGASVKAINRLGATPLHGAAAGSPGSPRWNSRAQREVIALLIEAGTDPNAADKRGVTPLHIAVRTRCAPAVEALIERGAELTRENRNGSTPTDFATQTTGRGGSGTSAARAPATNHHHSSQRPRCIDRCESS